MSLVGVRQIFSCSKGTLSGVPQYVIAMGYGDEASLEIIENTIKGYNEDDLPNEINFKASFKTYQPSLSRLAYLIQDYSSKNGADFQIVGEKQSAGVYSGVYNLNGNNFMGIDFEWVESMRSRYAQLIGEVALPYQEGLLVLQSAIVNSPEDLNVLGHGHRGKRIDLYKNPYFGSMQSPSGTILCNGYEVLDRVLTLKTEGDKLQYNRTRVKWIRLTLELTIDRSKSYELVEYLAKTRNTTLKLEEKDGATVVQTWDFGDGVLMRKQSMNINKNDAQIKLNYEKLLPLADFTINTALNKVSVTQNI